MWQSVARFFSAAFDEKFDLERQRKLTIAVLMTIMGIAGILIAVIVWCDIFYT